MLGHVVARYAAEAGCTVLTSDARYTAAPRDALVEEVRDSDASAVINCLGLTKQRSDDRAALYLTNSVFPVHLAGRLRPSQLLVHASTDCVFAGLRGGYHIEDECDATDAYGFSKVLGEEWPAAECCGPARLRGRTGSRRRSRTTRLVSPATGWAADLRVYQSPVEWRDHARLGCHGSGACDVAQPWREVPRLSQPGTTVATKYDVLCEFRDVFAPGTRWFRWPLPRRLIDRWCRPKSGLRFASS